MRIKNLYVWFVWIGVFTAKQVNYKLKDNGVVTKHIKDSILRFSPALTISEEDLRKGIDIIVDVVNSMPLNSWRI